MACRQRQREERRHFIAFFGSDLVVLSGEELAARMGAYWHFRMHEVRDAEGRSAADHFRERYGPAAQLPDADLPADLNEADTVGVVYDEVEGNYFWVDFGLLQETFADPTLAASRRYREAVLGYLEPPTISPLAFRRLAEPDPERASGVFRRVLKRPGFSWERDGEALPRRYKPNWFERPVLPSVTRSAGCCPTITSQIATSQIAGRAKAEAKLTGGPMRRLARDEDREKRISMEIVVDCYGPEEQAMGWYYSLEDRLGFPFVARCVAERAISPLRVSDEVEVVGMAPEEECAHEMFVLIRWERGTLGVPLAQLEGIRMDEQTRQVMEDWQYWVARYEL